jgi:hypothetical protein
MRSTLPVGRQACKVKGGGEGGCPQISQMAREGKFEQKGGSKVAQGSGREVPF